jgi:hypothetical protein
MHGPSNRHDLRVIEFRVPRLLEISIIRFEITHGTRSELTRPKATGFGQTQISTGFVIDQFFGLERLPNGPEQKLRASLGATLAGTDHQVRFGFEKGWFHVSPTIKTVTSLISTIAP